MSTLVSGFFHSVLRRLHTLVPAVLDGSFPIAIFMNPRTMCVSILVSILPLFYSPRSIRIKRKRYEREYPYVSSESVCVCVSRKRRRKGEREGPLFYSDGHLCGFQCGLL